MELLIWARPQKCPELAVSSFYKYSKSGRCLKRRRPDRSTTSLRPDPRPHTARWLPDCSQTGLPIPVARVKNASIGDHFDVRKQNKFGRRLRTSALFHIVHPETTTTPGGPADTVQPHRCFRQNRNTGCVPMCSGRTLHLSSARQQSARRAADEKTTGESLNRHAWADFARLMILRLWGWSLLSMALAAGWRRVTFDRHRQIGQAWSRNPEVTSVT